MHDEVHPLAGQTVILNDQAVDNLTGEVVPGSFYRIEDWWDHMTGGSWMAAEGNPAALKFAMRAGFSTLPVDDEVVYGKIGSFGHLVHASELGEPVS